MLRTQTRSLFGGHQAHAVRLNKPQSGISTGRRSRNINIRYAVSTFKPSTLNATPFCIGQTPGRAPFRPRRHTNPDARGILCFVLFGRKPYFQQNFKTPLQ